MFIQYLYSILLISTAFYSWIDGQIHGLDKNSVHVLKYIQQKYLYLFGLSDSFCTVCNYGLGEILARDFRYIFSHTIYMKLRCTLIELYGGLLQNILHVPCCNSSWFTVYCYGSELNIHTCTMYFLTSQKFNTITAETYNITNVLLQMT